jgi:urease accessory protein
MSRALDPRGWPGRALLAASALLLWAPPGQAHVEAGQAAGFLAGVAHPISGLDHVLAMIAVGLWGAQLGMPAVWMLPVTFPMIMALGGMLGLIGVPLPGVELGIAVSAILLGLAVMSELRPSLTATVAVVGLFGIFHGHAHGTELPPGQSALLYSVGFVIATGVLHGVGVAVGLVHGRPWGRRLLRVAGGGVAAAGFWFVWRAVA